MEENRTEMPTLTLNPFEELNKEPQAPAVPSAAQETAGAVQEAGGQGPMLDESMLSPEEKKIVDDFSKQIDLRNSTVILQYGAGAQKKIADFSEMALANVRTKDLGEIGELLS